MEKVQDQTQFGQAKLGNLGNAVIFAHLYSSDPNSTTHITLSNEHLQLHWTTLLGKGTKEMIGTRTNEDPNKRISDGSVAISLQFVDNKLNGFVTQWHKNGKVHMKYSYENGMLEGHAIEFNESGNKLVTCEYVRGKLHGEYIKWHENGNLAMIKHYKNGKGEGLETIYDKTGKKSRERMYLNGEINGCDNSYNNEMYILGCRKQDKKHGEEVWYKTNGQVIRKGMYEDGIFVCPKHGKEPRCTILVCKDAYRCHW